MKRLAIVTTHPIQYNAPLFKLLAARGFIQVKVFYTWGSSVLENKFDPGFGLTVKWDIPLLEGYEYCFPENISTVPGSHSFKGIDNPTLIKEIEIWKADAVLVYGWSFKSHLKCIRYFHKKIPVLFRGDSTLLDPQPVLKKALRYFFLKWIYSHIDTALYVGTNNKLYFKKYGVPDYKLVFAPHAVDIEYFWDDENKNYETKAKQWRENLSIRQSDMVFLFAGKLEEKKDPLLLVSAFNKLQNTNTYLIIAGAGPLEKKLKDNASANPNIKFIGFQNQSRMPVLYRLADYVILSSKGPGETWGLAINEAMACERAIVASDKTGCAVDLVKENINGFVFKSGDEDALVQVLTKILNDKIKAAQMGQASAQIIKEWNLLKTADAITAVVKLIENK
jgi:glycosyltransferase involved in cell wall biosynthesis